MNTAEITFRSTENNSSSQASLILKELEISRGEWVPMPHLASVSGAYAVHSRISDARRRGYNILHENRRYEGSKKVHSFYKLVPQ